MPLEPHPTDPNKLSMRAGNYNPRKLVAHTVIAGAVFDFMGYLTSRKERIVLSAADEASPAVDAISDFATKRGLSLDNARVRDWVDALAQPPAAQPEQEPTPWRDMVVVSLVREGINKHKARELADHFAATPASAGALGSMCFWPGVCWKTARACTQNFRG